MSAETATYSALSGAAGVTAIVSTRIYPDVLPQDTDYPSIVYQRTSTEPQDTVHSTVAREFATLQALCYETTRALAETLASACVTALRAAGFQILDRGAQYNAEIGLHVAAVSFRHFG